TGGADPHEHLAGAGLGIGDLVELQGFGAAELVNTDRLHVLLRSGGRPGAAGMRGHREFPTYETRSRGVVNRFVVVVIVCAAPVAAHADRESIWPRATMPARRRSATACGGGCSARARGCSPWVC